jgi:nitroreductase
MPDDTYDFILGLRAIRDYNPDPLSNEDLGAILEAGRWTGSSKNRQSWSFIAVTDPERIQGLAAHGDFTDPVRNSVATIVLVQEQGGNMIDIGRAAQNKMLAAAALGVASCPITLHRDTDAAKYLGIPDGAIARYAISLGYPAEDSKPANFGGRKKAAQVIKLDRY